MSLPTSPFTVLAPLYSSQSATSCYMECPRRYLYQYRLYGTGIVPKFSSVPLLTGNCIHKAIENIAGQYLSPDPFKPKWVDIDYAVSVAQEEYRNQIANRPLGNAHSEVDEQEMQFIIAEQLALTEALIRLWYLREWPKIIELYDILAVEQEITFQLGPVTYQAKPDLILLHKVNGDVVNYSLKSVKQGGDRLEKSYKVQLQAITEPYATSIWLRELAETLGNAKELLQNGNELLPSVSFMSKGLGIIGKTLEKYSNLPTKSSATRFCYLIKGDRKETEKGNGKYRTDSPFIYGLRKFTASGIEYAWTWWTKNPQNKSGFGRLGKGWEQFNIWEDGEVGGVKGWIEKLDRNDGIEGDLGDGHVIDKHILSQPDVYSNWGMIENRINQTTGIEENIVRGLKSLDYYHKEKATIAVEKFLQKEFPQNTGSCFFPSYCDYLSICSNGNDFYKQHIAEDPLNPEFDKFERRVSHHKPEKEEIEGIEKGEIENVVE